MHHVLVVAPWFWNLLVSRSVTCEIFAGLKRWTRAKGLVTWPIHLVTALTPPHSDTISLTYFLRLSSLHLAQSRKILHSFQAFQTSQVRRNEGDAIWTRPEGVMVVTRKKIPLGSSSMLFALVGKAEHLFRATFSPK